MLAWVLWLLVHIYFLSGFRNRLFVLIQWSWSYLTFARGTRLIVEKEWRSHANKQAQPKLATGTRPAPGDRAPQSGKVPLGSTLPAPGMVPIDAPFTASLRPAPAPAAAAPAADEADTATWESPLDSWDEPTTAYPPVRGT